PRGSLSSPNLTTMIPLPRRTGRFAETRVPHCCLGSLSAATPTLPLLRMAGLAVAVRRAAALAVRQDEADVTWPPLRDLATLRSTSVVSLDPGPEYRCISSSTHPSGHATFRRPMRR